MSMPLLAVAAVATFKGLIAAVAMVSNLLVVLCSEQATQQVVSTGSLNQ